MVRTIAPADALPSAFRLIRQNDLRNRAIAKEHKDECAEKLRERRSELMADPGPQQIRVRLDYMLLRNLVVDRRTVLSMWLVRCGCYWSLSLGVLVWLSVLRIFCMGCQWACRC